MKLLVLDVEGTLFKTNIHLPGTTIDSTVWQAIAQSLGEDAVKEEVDTHRKWHKGEYTSYLDWMKETITIHRRYNISYDVFRKIIDCSEYNLGVVETLKKLDRKKYEIVLISGGFRELTAKAQRDIGIFHIFAACEYQFGVDGLLQSYNLLPCDFEGKVDFIRLMLREYHLNSDDWIFVGDGANDMPIAKVAPISIGYRPHVELSEVVTHVINEFSELLGILDSI